jgi:hypothetical protein
VTPRAVVPIGQMTRRIPEAGRIRIGAKVPTSGGRSRPEKLSTFRFTSHDEQAINEIAAVYGGTPRPWNERTVAAGQFEVVTNASEIRVVLPAAPLGDGPVYEMWSGGGCQRRCDGQSCQVTQKGPDGPEPVEVPCMCAAAGELSCTVHTRLNVLLPDVRFSGSWRLDSQGWNVAQEMPGMVDLIQSLQSSALTRAFLALEQRKSTAGGQTRQFAVPVLRIGDSLEGLQAGLAALGAGAVLEQPRRAELPPVVDDEPADGEVVEADEVLPAETVDVIRKACEKRGMSPADIERVVENVTGDRYLLEQVRPAEYDAIKDAIKAWSGVTADHGGATAHHGGEPAVPAGGADAASLGDAPAPGEVSSSASPGNPKPGTITEKQKARLLIECKAMTREARLEWASGIVGRPVGSFSELTRSEASRLVDIVVAGQESQPTLGDAS